MTHKEVQRFFEDMIQQQVQCQLTPGILLQVEEISTQIDEEKNLHIQVVLGDEEWNDSVEFIFPPEKK